MILVTGSSGFVGGKLVSSCKNVIPCPTLRNATEDDIKRILEENDVKTIVHTAAISDIAACEKDPEASYIANVRLPIALARASKGIKLICFSSDQVYSGTEALGPYTEDMVKPSNVYARHKLEMEDRVLDIDPDAVMLRAEWMYDYYLKKSNYYMNILKAEDTFGVSSSQFRGLTYVGEVADNLESFIKLPGGAYNFGSETTKSMYEITESFLSSIKKEIKIVDTPPKHNLWLNCEKAKRFGVFFSSVEDGLIKCARNNGLIK